MRERRRGLPPANGPLTLLRLAHECTKELKPSRVDALDRADVDRDALPAFECGLQRVPELATAGDL